MTYKIKEEYKDIVRKEGDYHAFVHNGLKCRLIRYSGHWNGYVGVPKEHRAYGLKYNYWIDDEEREIYNESYLEKADRINSIEVHGGLTRADDSIHMQPEQDLRWFGFDTAHSGDLQVVDYGYTNFRDGKEVYRDKQYVLEQTKSLAEQLTASLEATKTILSS